MIAASPASFAALTACSSSGCFSARSPACAKNPIRASEWKIFCTPAVIVTVSSQTSGRSAIRASHGLRRAECGVFFVELHFQNDGGRQAQRNRRQHLVRDAEQRPERIDPSKRVAHP